MENKRYWDKQTSNIVITGDQKEEWGKIIFEDTAANNFPELMNAINLQVKNYKFKENHT